MASTVPPQRHAVDAAEGRAAGVRERNEHPACARLAVVAFVNDPSPIAEVSRVGSLKAALSTYHTLTMVRTMLELTALLSRAPVDVVIVDPELVPDSTALLALRDLVQRHPDVAVIGYVLRQPAALRAHAALAASTGGRCVVHGVDDEPEELRATIEGSFAYQLRRAS